MDCIFCKIINKEIPSRIVYEDEFLMAFLDVNPVSAGHTLIVPKKHIVDFYEIDNDMNIKILDCARKLANLLTEKLDADGITFVQNNGIAQDVKHFHLHIIPKYKNEKNISLDEVYKKITN